MEIKCRVLIIGKKDREGDQPMPNIVQLFDLQAKATIELTELANSLKSALHLVKNRVIIYELDNLPHCICYSISLCFPC